ncbi:gamma-aminobutyric acid type B receptor subunit 2-like [Saccostrea echinata]|uniref:gamma-aminobutyric acid type B receptor subunit 2-like n=1 Tax=Saccostrea echinata TaxID=191078 RepID=UPI002A83F721|nr:gamma-aminobutyric acid type B receptor subunit 2-like [Saccostrea echinata]
MMHSSLVIGALTVLINLDRVRSKVPLYVGGILGSSDDSWSKYANFYNILFKVAFEEINKTDILPNHELVFVSKNSKADPGLAAQCLFEHINEQPVKIAIFGPPKSDPYQIVGQITPKFNLTQMSFLAKTSNMIDRNLYSSTFMTNYIEDDLNPARLAMIKYFKWNKVATLFYNEEIFVSQMHEFHKLLNDENITLVTSGLIADMETVDVVIKRLKQYGARIIIGAFRSTKAPEIFCEIYKQKMYGKKYVWILTDSLYSGWLDRLEPGDAPGCSLQNIKDAAYGHFTLGQKQLRTDHVVTISGQTAEEYNTWMKNISSQYDPSTHLLSKYSPWAYDAAWALAVGLNNSMKYIGINKLEDFSYDRSDIYDAIQRGMSEVFFQGVSGAVSFNNGRRVGPAFIHINHEDRNDVAVYEPSNSSIEWWRTPHSLFQGGVIPRDSFQYIKRRFQQSYIGLSIVGLLIVTGVAVALGFLFFNVHYRKNKNIKMSSPRINNTIIGGGLLIYMAVIIMSVDYSVSLPCLNQHICMLNVWIISIGFTVGFGALFSKTFRVHILFTQGMIKKQTIKDAHLFGLLGVLVLLDILFLTLWTILHPLRLLEKNVEVELKDSDTILVETFHVCYNEFQSYWLSAQYISKGALLALGTFLAWETRHIKVPSLNDSKYIGFCVYNIVVVCALCVPVTFVLPPEKPTAKYVFTSIVCVFTTTLVLCILFIPKIKLRKSTDTIRFNQNLTKQNNLYKKPCKIGNEPTKTTHVSAVEDFGSEFNDKILEKNAINEQMSKTGSDIKLISVESERISTQSISENADFRKQKEYQRDFNCTSL